jgi:hypothetical protein
MSPYLGITIIFILCVLSIVVYGSFRCSVKDFKDPFAKSFVKEPFDRFLDGWGILHFIFYAVLAYMYPKMNTLIFIWLGGVLWELIESIFKDHPFYISKCNYVIDTDKGSWWYGRWQDIVMNTLGMVCGYYIRRR